PERRWQSMADIRAILEDMKQDLQSGQFARIAAPGAAAPRRSISRAWLYGGAGAVILAVAALTVWRSRPAETPSQLYTFRRMTSDTASKEAPTISPDGKVIA